MERRKSARRAQREPEATNCFEQMPDELVLKVLRFAQSFIRAHLQCQES